MNRRNANIPVYSSFPLPCPVPHRIIPAMKITDDYGAKYELWAREGKAVRLPRIANLPAFGHRRFDTYEQLAAWKQSLKDELLRQGGAKWTK